VKDRDFDSVVELARSSIIGQVVAWSTDAVRAAWVSSSFVGAAKRAWAPIAAWPRGTQIRCAALTLAWAGSGYAVSLFLLPRYAISGLPLAWVVSFVIASLVVAEFPGPFAIAWEARAEIRKSRTGAQEIGS
jgi:hypothetical protein